MHFSLSFRNLCTYTAAFLSLKPEGTAGPKSYAPQEPTNITSVSPPRTHCRSRVIIFPKSIADGTIADSRQTGVQELWTGKISHKTGTQCSNDNRKKTIYKFFPSCKIALPNKYLHKQKRNKHMTSYEEGLILLTEKLMPPNRWHLSNIIHHLLSWASV